MTKIFGVLFAAMLIFWSVGTADATPLGPGGRFGQGGFLDGDLTPPFGPGGRFGDGDITPPFGPAIIPGPVFGNGSLSNNNGLGGPHIQSNTHTSEPASLFLIGSGLLCLFGIKRKYRKI